MDICIYKEIEKKQCLDAWEEGDIYAREPVALYPERHGKQIGPMHKLQGYHLVCRSQDLSGCGTLVLLVK